MERTLLSRFQGALLGAAIGYSLGAQVQNKTVPYRQPANPPLFPHSQVLPLHPALALMLQGTQSLAAHGKMLRQDWVTFLTELSNRNLLGSTSELAIATLPLMLFFHEEESKLRQALQQVAELRTGNSSQNDGRELDELWVLSSIFTAALQEKLALPGWGLPFHPVQELLETRASLETARVQLTRGKEGSTSDNVIPLALYCFFSTPQSFYLTLCRSAYTGYHTEIICTLVGALSGVYNGITSIPIEWRLAAKSLRLRYTGQTTQLATDDSQTQALPHSWKPLPSEVVISETVQLAELLLATWSGVFAPGKTATIVSQMAAIAAPSVIRPYAQ